MNDAVAERLGELEAAVRRAAEALTRLREDNERLRRDIAQLTEERRSIVTQIDGILKDIGRLELD
jgi:chromosome segregation ATPase